MRTLVLGFSVFCLVLMFLLQATAQQPGGDRSKKTPTKKDSKVTAGKGATDFKKTTAGVTKGTASNNKGATATTKGPAGTNKVKPGNGQGAVGGGGFGGPVLVPGQNPMNVPKNKKP